MDYFKTFSQTDLLNPTKSKLSYQQIPDVMKLLKESSQTFRSLSKVTGIPETTIFFQKFENGDAIPDQVVRELVDLYPRVLVTPHIGSNTDEALSNMISFSFDNLNDILTTGTCDNLVPLPQ